jgi:hypothetical protein
MNRLLIIQRNDAKDASLKFCDLTPESESVILLRLAQAETPGPRADAMKTIRILFNFSLE